MSFTREDVLRELELLPMWQLRTPIPKMEDISQPPALPKSVVETLAETQAEAVLEMPEEVRPEAAKTTYEITISNDKNWCFICAADRTDISLQSTLFNNILTALQIEKPLKTQTQNLNNIDAKIIIAFGEAAAQTLLNSQDSLPNLRGKLHASNIIATYDCAQMLASPLLKAQVWQDLCLARNALQHLQLKA